MSKIPFSSDSEEVDKPNNIKAVSSVKSIFDNKNKKPLKAEFEQKVKNIQENISSYKQRAFDLGSKFKKILDDKTLLQNKNIFILDLEKEIILKMANLAMEINNDENEKLETGSLGWIILLLKSVLWHRDRINKLEYDLVQLNKKILSLEFDRTKIDD